VNAQFIIAVMSSLTTAAILYGVRQIYKARKALVRLANEHRFLLRSVSLILVHLDLEKQAEELGKR